MPINFPNSPSLNQVYTFNGRSWEWTGVAWKSVTAAYGPTGPTGGTGSQGVTGSTGPIPTSDDDQLIIAIQVFGQEYKMATFTKTLLSGSTQGKAIKIAATTSGSAGTTIHATGTSASIQDEVWLYAYNSAATATVLTIQWGGVTAVDNEIKLSIPATSGLTLVIPGFILTGTGSAANTIAAYAATTNVITVTGYVNRIA